MTSSCPLNQHTSNSVIKISI
uniref:Uncharacterized protein n=1 Tax=Anguilla anguilla TaxID=7936 RepID=A0A0E9PPY1_ANGAN